MSSVAASSSQHRASLRRLLLPLAGAIGFVALWEALHGTAGGGKETPRATQRIPRGVPHEADIVELLPEDANGNLGKVFRSIRGHLPFGMVPDDFRALGRWPKYLQLAWDDARKRDSDSRAREQTWQRRELLRLLRVEWARS